MTLDRGFTESIESAIAMDPQIDGRLNEFRWPKQDGGTEMAQRPWREPGGANTGVFASTSNPVFSTMNTNQPLLPTPEPLQSFELFASQPATLVPF